MLRIATPSETVFHYTDAHNFWEIAADPHGFISIYKTQNANKSTESVYQADPNLPIYLIPAQNALNLWADGKIALALYEPGAVPWAMEWEQIISRVQEEDGYYFGTKSPLSLAVFEGFAFNGILCFSHYDRGHYTDNTRNGAVLRFKDPKNHLFVGIQAWNKTIQLWQVDQALYWPLTAPTKIRDYQPQGRNLVTVFLNDDLIQVGVNGNPNVLTATDTTRYTKFGLRFGSDHGIAISNLDWPVRYQPVWSPKTTLRHTSHFRRKY